VAARTGTELRDVVDRITDAGGTARSYRVDLGDPEEIDSLLAELDRDVGAVDVLVNNAGIARGGQPLWSADPTEWWRVLEVNLRAPMILSARLLEGMIARGSGYIINVASLAGARPTPMASAYAVSKAALARLGDSMARELTEAGHGITVFTISPGLVRTDMTAGVPAFESLPPEAWSPVEETGALVRKLVSGEYDELSGRFVHVDFDLEEMVASVPEITEEELYVLRLPALDGLVE
jgi:NAD(P)-dependent dehydrogenase (short-subunit alcohol dehydrogenase family)